MKLTSTIAIFFTLIYMFGFTIPSTEGRLPLRALLLLHRFARSERLRTQRMRPSWGEWTLWSMCTTTTEEGVRIRSRACNTGSCDNLPGNNYEIQTCRIQAMPDEVQKPSYMEKCTNDPTMNGTLSCRLYRENPIMAYGIFRSAGCIFNVVGDMPNIGEIENMTPGMHELVFGRSPDPRNGEVGLEFLNQLDTKPLFSGHLNGDETNEETHPRSSLAQNAAQTTMDNRICIATCERIVLEGTKVSRLGNNPPKTIKALIQFLSGNIFYRDNSATILSEYNSCLTTCSASRSSVEYTGIRESLIDLGLDPTQQNSDLVVTMTEPDEYQGEARRRRNIPEQNVSYPQYPEPSDSNFSNAHPTPGTFIPRPERLNKVEARSFYQRIIDSYKSGYDPRLIQTGRNRYESISQSLSPTKPSTIPIQIENLSNYTGSYESQNQTTTTPTSSSNSRENETLTRRKRQLNRFIPPRNPNNRLNPDDFISPCFERVDETNNPRVLNLDDTEGELFFYEGREQRFMRRRCVGVGLVPGKLYQAQEAVIQQRTNSLAVCKQGFLVRYGLIIQLDSRGEFAFNDGERFSIRFRPFKLESHCALSIVH